jgi:HK97 family phage prohead protease
MHKTKRAPIYGFKLLPADEGAEGTFEAIVAVFGNVDHVGDRIIAGAFADSIAEWKASGDPIPVLFSHRWDDLDAHIGEVLEAEELGPGDARLPDAIKDIGGLYIKALLHVDEDYAGRVWRKLNRRTLREFSFAYDVLESVEVNDPIAAGHRVDLVKLGIIEVGPTLKGCNPITQLIGAKARAAGKTGAADLLDELGELTDLEDIVDDALLERALETLGQAAGGDLDELDTDEEVDLDDGALELPEGVTLEDLTALEAGVTGAVDNLLGAVTEALRSTARDLVLGALASTSTTGEGGAGTVAGQEEDDANAGDKAGRGAKAPPKTTLADLDLLELEVSIL